MFTLRPARERGETTLDWLDSKHTFSFGHYHDPGHMGFGDLRVINEDRVRPSAGFDTHGHRDMEIVTCVLEGALEHRDTLGTGSVIRPGEVQRMTAGTGIRHSEFNHSDTEPVHFFQIWILPQACGLAPSYDQRSFTEEERRGRLRLLVSGDGRDGSLTVHQDVDLHGSLLEEGQEVAHALRPGRMAWIQMARGTVVANGYLLDEGDGAAIARTDTLSVRAGSRAELLLIDLSAPR